MICSASSDGNHPQPIAFHDIGMQMVVGHSPPVAIVGLPKSIFKISATESPKMLWLNGKVQLRPRTGTPRVHAAGRSPRRSPLKIAVSESSRERI